MQEPAAQRVGVDEVRERLLSVDRDDRDALAIPPLELRIGGDVHLAKLEGNVRADALEHCQRAVAEVAAFGAEERDDGQRSYG